MIETRRPRVAVIGLDDRQVESITHLCGDLRSATSLREYLREYSATETDVLVTNTLHGQGVIVGFHVFSIGSATSLKYMHYHSDFGISESRNMYMSPSTEREVRVNKACPKSYEALAGDLSRQLLHSGDPTPTITMSWHPDNDQRNLIETSSGRPIALRYTLVHGLAADGAITPSVVGIALPEAANLLAWCRAFLCEIHELDPERVPQSPPRLGNPSDWYTPEESALAERIEVIAGEISHLEEEREALRARLVAAGETADADIRRTIWADGDELVAAVEKILTCFGFVVRNMDSELEEGEPKREDLRLTLESKSGWEAIVEIKGYSKGTRTNDADRIRQYRERYSIEKSRTPDLTLWIANPHREMDPTSRPGPDGNVRKTAQIIGAVHVLTTDLYLQWALIEHGRTAAEDVIKQLVSAVPGLWAPSAPDPAT